MSLAHMTLATPHVRETAAFLAKVFGFSENPSPMNSPVEVAWLDIGRGQELHVIFVEDFVASPFEAEFGRHIAFHLPLDEFEGIKASVAEAGGEIFDALRKAPYERFFFRDPINRYVFEVIDELRTPKAHA